MAKKPIGGGLVHNKSLQWTFDPSPVFASAITAAASNAPELKRWAARKDQLVIRSRNTTAPESEVPGMPVLEKYS
ncbi:hypothetical protein RM530_01850 [Algiphilus sp. W345]|uniref:Uncharacterized protein n=1 Tax=Banduia mediterranea TaxID=3075609 RepID=A0ABU2WFN7_9GAMM|nr:hypothetical protein [Algiphilus sp. W345]MDT0496111.1 hypothetical protein [Algiphilus sp. W345]